MMITFSGIDGAGKSTLIDLLKSRLEQRECRVTVFHLNDHVGLYAYLRVVRDLLVGAPRPAEAGRPEPAAAGPETPGPLAAAARRARNAVLWNQPVRQVVYLADILIFLFYRLYFETVRKRVLVMDRYFYDRLVDVDDGRRRLRLRLLALITPTPCVPVYLDISPEEAFARKGEYTVEYLRRRRESYRSLFPRVRRSVIISTDGDLAATARDLERVVLERMPAR